MSEKIEVDRYEYEKLANNHARLRTAAAEGLKFIQQVCATSAFHYQEDGIRAEVRLVDALNADAKENP